MKNIRKIIYYNVLVLIALALISVSCKDEEPEDLKLSRRFRPASIETLSGETSAALEWSPSLFALPGEVEYQVELAKDADFTNVEFTQTTTESGLVIPDTEIDIRIDYFARVKALGKDGMGDSNWLMSEAFQITGEIFILPVAEADVVVDAAKIKWAADDDVLTKVVITPADGGASIEVALTAEESAAGEKIVQGLTANTNYTAEIFLGNVSKGSVTFTTKLSYAGSNVIDLREITGRPDVLSDTLDQIASGSVVLLKRGQTYEISSKELDRSVTITSGADFIAEFATIFITSNLNIVASSSIDSLIFKDLNLTGEAYGSDYVFNINRVGTIGTVRFDNVRGHRFRGFFRAQTGTTGTQVEKLFINNCVIDSLRDFSLVNTNNSNTVANIRVTNTTLYDARKVIDHRSPGSNSIVFENCTFNNLPTGGPTGAGTFYFIDLNTQDVANGITITNCIFGKSRDEGMGGVDVRGIRAGGATNVIVTNSYKTSDFISTDPVYQIPGVLDYPGESTSLFANPSAGDFTIIDAEFPGATNAGDPRWR